MLSQLAYYADEVALAYPDLDWESVTTAILWHDAMYSPKSSINEFMAATKFRKVAGYNQRVISLILSTAQGYNGYKSPEEKVLHDLDYICFNSFDNLRKASDQVIQEYVDAGFPEEDCTSGRIAFLEDLLSSGGVFVSDVFVSRFSDAPKLAIEAEITRLRNLVSE
jgi:predicted metal-dependent HD superfamily phosphohydrolase